MLLLGRRPVLTSPADKTDSIGEALAMTGQTRQLPPLPEIGHPEAYYAKQVHLADRVSDRHAHEANKVGQYVTLDGAGGARVRVDDVPLLRSPPTSCTLSRTCSFSCCADSRARSISASREAPIT